MSFESGQMLLHYRLVQKIGEGGMGVVWKAVDTTLDREVAIKILPESFAQDADRLTRFEREAKLLAALNHPNIAAVHGLHEAEGLRFIVMELVDGETLADRLERSGLRIEDTLEVGKQIAEALEAAHDRGIVHRDLKPANVRIRRDGTVKVLDFGLARAMANDPLTGSSADAPTAAAGTKPGIVLGTAPYMSPEQARGMTVDKRTDIWSLGCVLYECLAGRRPFDGATTTDVLAQIVSHQPDFGSLPRGTPDFLARLVRRCLEKDSRRRLRDAGELRVAVEEFQSNPDSEVFRTTVPARRSLFSNSLLPWAVVVVLGGALAYLLSGRAPHSDASPPAVSRWSIALPRDSRVGLPSPGGGFDYSRTVAISRDGSRIAFSVQDQQDQAELYIKMEAAEPRPIPGTTNARAPFFSPDGQWLGFYDNDNNTVHKVALQGGSPQKLCDIGRVISFDASWAPDGKTIVFATDDGLWRVSAAGGSVEQLTKPDGERGEVGHHSPRFTSDGRGVLFTVSITPEMHLALLSLDTGTWEIVIRNASLGIPVKQDRIIFARSGELLAAPYDTGAHRVVGSTVPVLQGLQTTRGLGGVVLTQYDVSDTGTLAYVPAAAAKPVDQLLWVDFRGNETVITEGAGTWVHPRLSPDGSRISLDIHSPDGMRDVHIYEIQRGQFRQLTRTGVTWESEWRPDGKRITIMSGAPAGQWSLFWAPTDFSGPAELLFRSSHAIPGSWLPDGRSFLFSEWVEGGIWWLSPEGDRKPEFVMATSAQEGFPRLSPDGKWIAFVEEESRRREVFVQSFPDLGPKHKVSIDGGGEPVWSRDGRKLFFRKRNRMLSVDVEYEPALRFGQPRVLFMGNYDAAAVGHQHYDISLDGKKFLMIKHGEPIGPGVVRVVLNWSEELKTLVTVGGAD